MNKITKHTIKCTSCGKVSVNVEVVERDNGVVVKTQKCPNCGAIQDHHGNIIEQPAKGIDP